MTSSFMLLAARDDPIEVKLPLPPSTSDRRADAGKKHSKLQRSLSSTVLALRRYFNLGERSDAHVRHDQLELRVPRAAAVLAALPASPQFTLKQGVLPFVLRCLQGLRHSFMFPGVAELDARCNRAGQGARWAWRSSAVRSGAGFGGTTLSASRVPMEPPWLVAAWSASQRGY